MTDPLYPESAAYHEAGHIVVAAVLGLRLSSHGIRLDGEGKGIAYYKGHWNKASEFRQTIEDRVVAALAGLIAQEKFYPECSPSGANEDEKLVNYLLQNIYPDASSTDFKRSQLLEKSKNLVTQHWEAICAVVNALWRKCPRKRRVDSEPDSSWSDCRCERWLPGAEIVSILNNFQIWAVSDGFVD
jgi:ATP-dependent Zn protease